MPITKVRLEACTLCQLNCKACFMRLGNYCNRGIGYLKFENFEKFLELNPQVKEIELSSSGEIFLNPDLSKIMELAFNEGVKLTAWGGANFNTVSPEVLENLVKYNFEGITISLDGWNQESYVPYRRGGNFFDVINNIRALNLLKSKYRSLRPILTWKYIIFEHNDDVNGAIRAQQMAKELHMSFYFSKDWDGYHPKNIKSEDPNERVFRGTPTPCSQMWLNPQINWDGRFLGCCANTLAYDFDKENMFKVPLSEYMERRIIKDTQLMLMGEQPVCSANPNCEKCWYYRIMCEKNDFITDQELQEGGRFVSIE